MQVLGYDDKALVSLNSIIGYMPTLPHWGYNGNARRYWDFLYPGRIRRIERQLHHYGSGLNFFGHALTVGTYLINHPEFGWRAFGGNVSRSDEWVNVQPLDFFASVFTSRRLVCG